MTAKNYVLSVIIFSITFLSLVGVVGGIVIDPFNIFHADVMRHNGVSSNHNYVKTKYILQNPDKFNSFMFGSSKVGAIHTEKIKDEKCYNMTYTRGLPAEHLDKIKTFLSGGVSIDKIYMGIDSESYTNDPKDHIDSNMACPYEYLTTHPWQFVKLYMRPGMILSSIALILRSQQQDRRDFYKYGVTVPYGKIYNDNLNIGKMIPDIGDGYYLEEVLKTIKEIVDICKANNIKLVIFINPMYEATYRASLEKNFIEFLTRLADITEYYNFGGFNDVACDTASFSDQTHYTAETGDLIREVIYNGKKYDRLYEQGFGWKVTKDNLQEFLSIPEISGQEKQL